MWGFQQRAIQPALDTHALRGTENIGHVTAAGTLNQARADTSVVAANLP